MYPASASTLRPELRFFLHLKILSPGLNRPGLFFSVAVPVTGELRSCAIMAQEMLGTETGTPASSRPTLSSGAVTADFSS